MRHLTGPWNGFGADADMVAYWRFNDLNTTPVSGDTTADGRLLQLKDVTTNKALTLISNGATHAKATSLYSPRTTDTSFRFGTGASAAWRSDPIMPDALIFNPIDYPTLYQGGTGEWTIAGWYSVTNTTSNLPTVCFIEHGEPLPTVDLNYIRLMYNRPSGASIASPIQWYVEASAVDGTSSLAQVNKQWLCPRTLPRNGMIAVAARYNYGGGTPHMELDWYHSSIPDLYAGRSAIQAMVPFIGNGYATKWSIGDINQQTSGATISNFSAPQQICEIGVWPRHLGPTGVRRLYRNCVKPWDDADILDVGSKVQCRVVLEDGLEKDLTKLFEMDYVQEVSISDSADDSNTKAKIKLIRKKGPLEDLSPISSTSDFTSYIKLRRRLRIERAYVPHEWTLQGWEWETAFVGYVDSWEFDDFSITIDCTDQSCVLEDAQILDNRAYNMYTNNLSMEAHQQQLLNDYVPKALSGTYYAYKGMSSTGYLLKMAPSVYGFAGRESGYSNYTVTFSERVGVVDADWNLNYNDVSSGSVMNALRAVSDQIGFETRFIYHAPWDYYRLTTYDALRQKTPYEGYSFKGVRQHYRIIQTGARTAIAEFLEPHGLVVGSSGTIFVTGLDSSDNSFAQSYTVTGSTSPYTCVLQAATADLTGYATMSEVGGVFYAGNNYEFQLRNLAQMSPLSTNIEDIRNSVNIKYNRSSKADVHEAIDYIVVSASQVGSIVSPVSGRFRTIDPDRNGISLTMAGWDTGAATNFNGNWTARRSTTSDRAIVLNEPIPGAVTPGIYYVTSTTNSSAYFKSPYVLFNEVYGEDETSIAEYGLRSCSVYEGSTLGIDTYEEAIRLADTIIADLAQPIADLQITSRVTPVEINDYVKLPVDFKGRYEESHRIMTVTGKEERYSSGTSEATYNLRVGLKPTRGRTYVGRMLTGFGAPAPAINMPANKDLIAHYMPFDGVKIDTLGEIQFTLADTFQASTVNKTSLRHDQTIVHTSTASSGFIPNATTLKGEFRGNTVKIPATPGQTTYIKMGVKDKFGNLSPMNGVGLASTATIYSVTPRFTSLTAGALLFPSAATTERLFTSSTYTPMFMTHSSTSFSSRGFDTYSNFVTASALWRMPCDGVVSVEGEFDVRIDAGSGTLNCRVNKLRDLSGVLTSFGASAPTAETISNTTFGSTSRKSYAFLISASSGDYLRFELSVGTAAKTFYVGSQVNSSATAPFLRYNLISETRHGDQGT